MVYMQLILEVPAVLAANGAYTEGQRRNALRALFP
jgi:hypothetical protein